MGGCPPINSVYVQYPQQKSPQEIWFLTQWTELNYDGAFFRSSGGKASSFIEDGNTLTVQSQATAVNGLTIPSSGSHTHTRNMPHTTLAGGGYDALIVSGSNTTSMSWTGGSHTHTINGDEETRPINYTVKIWKRTA